MLKVLDCTRLKYNVPLIVVVLPVAPPPSPVTVTVVPVAITTGLHWVGTMPESQVDVRLQELEAILVKVLQPTGSQCT